jgi:hypothetical protein
VRELIAFFGQLLCKAAAEITFAHTVCSVQQTAGADIAKLLQAASKFLKARVRMSYGIAFDHVRVGSLLKQVDKDLDAAAEDVIVAEPDDETDDDTEVIES